MDTRSPPSTLTQTWQVGPGRGNYVVTGNEEFENTLTVLPLRSVFRVFSRAGVLLRAFDLPPGTHSFFLEENDAVGHALGPHPQAEFEINVYMEGGFFVDVTGRRRALVNGRECFWTRLRSGDEIHFGREKWVVEAAEGVQLEETFARVKPNIELPSELVLYPPPAPSFPDVQPAQPLAKPRAKLVVFVVIASVVTSLLSAYVGYGLAKEQEVVYVTERKDHLAAQDDNLELEKEEVIRETVISKFDESMLVNILSLFRDGKNAEACAALKAKAPELQGDGVWARKARFLLGRRCAG